MPTAPKAAPAVSPEEHQRVVKQLAQAETQLQQLGARLDAERAAYVKVPRRLWEIIKTWNPIISRVRTQASFIATLKEYGEYQEAQPLFAEVVE